jgi:hypothetical protein
MNQINRELIEDSLRYFYKENWRQGLLTHILIGIGDIIRGVFEPESPESQEALFEDFVEKEIERLKPIRNLEEHPMEYVQEIDERIALEVLNQLSLILRIAFGGDIRWVFPDIDLLFTTIANQAFDKLLGVYKDEFSIFAEKFVRKSWATAHPLVREGILEIIRLHSILVEDVGNAAWKQH